MYRSVLLVLLTACLIQSLSFSVEAVVHESLEKVFELSFERAPPANLNYTKVITVRGKKTIEQPVKDSKGLLFSWIFGRKNRKSIISETLDANITIYGPVGSTNEFERADIVSSASSLKSFNSIIVPIDQKRYERGLSTLQTAKLEALSKSLRLYIERMTQMLQKMQKQTSDKMLQKQLRQARRETVKNLVCMSQGDNVFLINVPNMVPFLVIKSTFLVYVLQGDFDFDKLDAEDSIDQIFRTWKTWTITTASRNKYRRQLLYNIYTDDVKLNLSGKPTNESIAPLQSISLNFTNSNMVAQFFKNAALENVFLPEQVQVALSFFFYQYWNI